MNSVGVHALVWVGEWTGEAPRRAMTGARESGYDRIEIPLLDTWQIDVPATRALLTEHQLAMTANQFLTAATDITSPSGEVVAAGAALLHRAVDTVAGLGGDYICGTLYSRLGRYDTQPTKAGRRSSAAVLSEVAAHAAESGIRIGLELCNRYETNLLNTARQALELLELIDRPNAVVHLDTFHMNLEETDLVSPVLECGERLGYVHIGESNRGYLGTGTVDFDGFFGALGQIGYAGPITFESFSSAVLAPELTGALCIWRDLWEDSADLASHARQFIARQLARQPAR